MICDVRDNVIISIFSSVFQVRVQSFKFRRVNSDFISKTFVVVILISSFLPVVSPVCFHSVCQCFYQTFILTFPIEYLTIDGASDV